MIDVKLPSTLRGFITMCVVIGIILILIFSSGGTTMVGLIVGVAFCGYIAYIMLHRLNNWFKSGSLRRGGD